jgi:hypothetical protein
MITKDYTYNWDGKGKVLISGSKRKSNYINVERRIIIRNLTNNGYLSVWTWGEDPPIEITSILISGSNSLQFEIYDTCDPLYLIKCGAS